MVKTPCMASELQMKLKDTIHGCIPLDEKGDFKELTLLGEKYKGKALCDQFDLISRRAYFNREHPETRNKDRDYMWYLWSGAYSLLFGKKKMATFERYRSSSPVKAEGKLFVIDGGMSKPYQKVTGIAGYTLIYDSYSLILAEHTSFESKHKAIHYEVDIVSTRSMIEHATKRIRVGDTYIGANLRQQILDLNRLLDAYIIGVVKVKSVG